MHQPLAERLRPQTLDEYIGQTHLVGPDSIIRRMIETGHVASFILWGPPGVGKTTLARIIANTVKAPFFTLSAVSSGVKEVREVIDRCKREASSMFATSRPVLFIDEIHRFSKSQQDSLLGAVENGTVTLMPLRTENKQTARFLDLLSLFLDLLVVLLVKVTVYLTGVKDLLVIRLGVAYRLVYNVVLHTLFSSYFFAHTFFQGFYLPQKYRKTLFSITQSIHRIPV